MIKSILDKGKAEKLLTDNTETCACSDYTYDLSLKLLKEDDYSGAVKLLNNAIKYSDNKEKYRTLRKKIIMGRLIEDLGFEDNKKNKRSS
jgi:hypothetical protein